MRRGGLWSLQGSHTQFYKGIDAVREYGDKTYLYLHGVGKNGERKRIHIPLTPFGNDRGAPLPPIQGTRLMSATAIVQGDQIVALSAGEPYAVGVLFIDASRLAFCDIKPIFPSAVGRPLILPGGEGVGVPYARAGDRASAAQQQLFVLREDQHIIVSDDSNRTARVWFREGCFHSAPTTKNDLITHVIGRGMNAASDAEIRWCLRMLKKLDARDFADLVLAKAWSLNKNYRLDWDML